MQNLRLDGEEDEIGVVRGLTVALRGEDPESLLKPLPAIFSRMAGDDVLGRDEGVLEETRDHGLGHDSRSDESDSRLAEGT